jgi:hypothetical protein
VMSLPPLKSGNKMKDNCNFWGIVAQDECFCFSSNLNFFI